MEYEDEQYIRTFGKPLVSLVQICRRGKLSFPMVFKPYNWPQPKLMLGFLPGSVAKEPHFYNCLSRISTEESDFGFGWPLGPDAGQLAGVRNVRVDYSQAIIEFAWNA